MLECTLAVTLTVRGPFLCSAAGPGAWGLDAVFHKNENDGFCIPKSHVKGKLREAWNLFQRMKALDPDIDGLLGKRTKGKEGFLPHKGKMVFSDFICMDMDAGAALSKNHRIRMDRVTGTADQGALFTCETPFKSNGKTQWKGEISYPAADAAEAGRIREHVEAGLKWIFALGAEKGVGFGRLFKVSVAEASRIVHDPQNIRETGPVREYKLSIIPMEPLTMGMKKIKDNYMETGKILTGAVIKGSLAQCIRRRTGLAENAPIAPGPELEAAGLPLLAGCFEQIRFTHGFPSTTSRRPVMPPHSIAKDNMGRFDLALENGPEIRKGPDGKSMHPAFRTDWKDKDIWKLFAGYGWAEPRVIAMTRTAIDPETQRARDDKLYTFEYLCPGDESKNPVAWLSRVVLPDGLSQEEHKQLCGELEYVIENWFDRAGKRGGKIDRPVLEQGPWTPSMPSEAPLMDGTAVIALQTDALILDPGEIGRGHETQLHGLYSEYWKSASAGAFEMTAHFAVHDLWGGYAGRRFPTNGQYRPFLPTSAGSVFVLKAVLPDKAETVCNKWSARGLPPPAWSLAVYGESGKGRLDWKNCPYTRENGFGEIAVNLSCHWNERRKS